VQEFQVHRVLEPSLRMKAQVTPAKEVRKILFVEKRRERLHIGECKGTRKPVVPVVGVGIGFYNLFALPECRDVSQVQTEVSWEREVSP
jgi:hypothetical protein